MKYALIISILMHSGLRAFELAIGPGADSDALVLNKPINFITQLTSCGGWTRTDKGDFEYGSCVYTDPHGKFSVGWKHFAGRITHIYYSRGPNRVVLEEANLVQAKKGEKMVLNTETGEFKITPEAQSNPPRNPEPGGVNHPATAPKLKSEGQKVRSVWLHEDFAGWFVDIKDCVPVGGQGVF